MLKEATSSNFTDTEIQNVLEASNATGVNPAWIAGMLKIESGGDCRARAFNNDWLKRKARIYGESYSALVRAGLNIGASGDKSYSDHRRKNSYFERAFKIAPKTAIAVTAWGTYQVMGRALLRLAGGNPYLAKKMFFNDPCDMSVKLFISWIKHASPSFIENANLAIATGQRKYFAQTVKKYLGKPKPKYIDLLIKYSNKFKNEQTTKNKVYILGDSNTTPHRNYWKSFAKKNFGNNIEIVWKAQDGSSTEAALRKLKDVKQAAGVIVGSIGGNDAAGLENASKSKINSTLSPGGAYYNKHIVPFMARMKELQDQGAKILIFGLPFGRGKTKNREYARQAMDVAFATGAQQFGIPYKSVFEATKLVKGKSGGVHYGSKKEEYRDVLRNSGLGNHPSSEDEIAYANDVANNRAGKKIKISRNRFLRPYKYIQKAGMTFDTLYDLFNKAFGSGWVADLLPVHGKDRIFGPEHFTAMAALSKKLEKVATPMAQTIRNLVAHKDPNRTEPAFAKAEKETAKDISKNADLTPILPKDIFKDKPDSEIAAASSMATGNVIFATADNFRQEAIAYSSKMPVFVDFGADYCGPCRQLDPVLNKIAQKHKGSLRIVKVDITKQPEITKHFSSLLSNGIPLVLAFYKGKIVDSMRGFSSVGEERVHQFVNNILASVKTKQPRIDVAKEKPPVLPPTERKPARVVTFEEAIASGKPGDQFILNFKKPVKYMGFITVFKAGKTYTGSTILSNGNVSVSSEQGTHELSMKDFIEKIQERGKPCQILNCDKSFIIRPRVGKKSFTNFLKNPSFDDKRLAETKIKKQKRFILKYRSNK